MNYARAIKTIRAAKGISQKDLSSLIKMDASYLSRIEKGERVPSIEVIEEISKGLGVPFYLTTLLASDKEDLQKLPVKDTHQVGMQLLEMLLESEEKEEE